MAYKGEIEPIIKMKNPVEVKTKWHKYKVAMRLASDRDDAIRIILDKDPDAIVNPRGSWNFRVKTKLTYAELFNAIIRHRGITLDTVRKAWWV